MSARIDYRFNAQERVKVAVTHPNETQAQTVALIANAEATLALVEQQRIANLIALSEATHANGSRVSPFAIAEPVDDYSAALKAEIREALGL